VRTIKTRNYGHEIGIDIIEGKQKKQRKILNKKILSSETKKKQLSQPELTY